MSNSDQSGQKSTFALWRPRLLPVAAVSLALLLGASSDLDDGDTRAAVIKVAVITASWVLTGVLWRLDKRRDS